MSRSGLPARIRFGKGRGSIPLGTAAKGGARRVPPKVEEWLKATCSIPFVLLCFLEKLQLAGKAAAANGNENTHAHAVAAYWEE